MSRLTFVLHLETGMRLAREEGCIFARAPSAIPGLIAHLEAGRDVVALMHPLSTGFRVPEGVEIVFHPECPVAGPLRAQCEGRAYRAPGRTGPEKESNPSLVYVVRPSQALALAELIGAQAVVHPSDLAKVSETLSAGGRVVMPIELAGEDFRLPRGSGIFFDPALETDPRRPRAGIHAMLCGATSVSVTEASMLTTQLTELARGRVVFGAFASVEDRMDEPDIA